MYSSQKLAATQEAYVLECWKQISNAWVQATESESWRTKPISRPYSGAAGGVIIPACLAPASLIRPTPKKTPIA